MKTFFKVIRYIISIILIIPLFLLLIVSPPLIATSQTVTHRENIKNVLDQSGIYDNLMDIVVPILTQSSGESEEMAELFEEGSDFRVALDQELTATKIKTKVDTVIDSIYDWLEDKTISPQFDIYLIESDEAIKNVFSSMLIGRMEALPTCSTYNQLETAMQNPMEAECKPSDFDSEQITVMVNENMTSDQIDQIKTQFRLSSEDMNFSGEDAEMYKNLFIILRWLHIILIVVMAVLTILILLLIPGWKGSFITLSILYLIPGLIWLVASLMNPFKKALKLAELSTGTQAQMQTLFINLFSPLFLTLTSRMRVFALIVIAIGVLFLIVGILLKKKKKSTEKVLEKQPKKDEKETKQKTRPKKEKITQSKS
jgi:hypothetical protein